MMISLVIKLEPVMPTNLYFTLPILAISLISFFSFIIAKYLEPQLKNILKLSYSPKANQSKIE